LPTLDPKMNVTPTTTATKSRETRNVPLTSIRRPNVTGIKRGPMFPSEEMRSTTLPAEKERRSCSTGSVSVMVRGIERRKIFRDNKDKDNLVQRLGNIIKDTSAHCYAWSLLSNHVHPARLHILAKSPVLKEFI
jgi:hypothetical protein